MSKRSITSVKNVPILSGEEIVNTALALVGNEALHYHEWFNRLHRGGYAVAGKDPLAVVCSALNRHPLVKRAGDGIYQRDEDALQNLRDAIDVYRRGVVTHINNPAKRDPLITELRKTEHIVARLDKRGMDACHTWSPVRLYSVGEVIA